MMVISPEDWNSRRSISLVSTVNLLSISNQVVVSHETNEIIGEWFAVKVHDILEFRSIRHSSFSCKKKKTFFILIIP